MFCYFTHLFFVKGFLEKCVSSMRQLVIAWLGQHKSESTCQKAVIYGVQSIQRHAFIIFSTPFSLNIPYCGVNYVNLYYFLSIQSENYKVFKDPEYVTFHFTWIHGYGYENSYKVWSDVLHKIPYLHFT